MTNCDLLCFGEALYELAELDSGQWQGGIGGDVSNVAIAAARQGVRAGMLGRLGADRFGRAVRSVWEREGVDHRHVAEDESRPTGVYFVTYENGEHGFEYRRAGSAASCMSASMLAPEALAGCRALHVSGISQAIGAAPRAAVAEAMAQVKARGGLVSYDPNLRLRLWSLEQARAGADEALALADIALPGLDDARALTRLHAPQDILRAYHEKGAAIVALTLGAKGVLLGHGNGEITEIAGHQVDAIDATGAGDCFDGTFLARLLLGDDPREAAHYATAASALSVTAKGAIQAIPSPEEIARFRLGV